MSHSHAPNQLVTVRAVVERYLQHCLSNNVHTPDARSERTRTFKQFLAWVPDQASGFPLTSGSPPIGDWPLVNCQPFHLQDWIESNPKWKSSSTRKAKANIVNAAFNWARKGRRITDNPFEHVNYEEAERRPCMPDEVLQVVMEKANLKFERALTFLRLTGCRQSSMFRLRWEHIDWDSKIPVARLPVSMSKSGKKKKKGTTIILLPEAVELLRKVKAEDFHEGEVFRNNRGKPWNRGLLGQQLRRMKKRLDLREAATLHGIRHQVGTTAVRNGTSIKFVSRFLGHSSTAVTEKHYVHDEADLDAMLVAAQAARPKTIDPSDA
jgi:integrase